jgi:hypothetical protein
VVAVQPSGGLPVHNELRTGEVLAVVEQRQQCISNRCWPAMMVCCKLAATYQQGSQVWRWTDVPQMPGTGRAREVSVGLLGKALGIKSETVKQCDQSRVGTGSMDKMGDVFVHRATALRFTVRALA